jgi:hypothetical protein
MSHWGRIKLTHKFKFKPIEDARGSFLSVFGKVRKTGSNPASPANKEKTEIQIVTGISVFFVVINLLLKIGVFKKLGLKTI